MQASVVNCYWDDRRCGYVSISAAGEWVFLCDRTDWRVSEWAPLIRGRRIMPIRAGGGSLSDRSPRPHAHIFTHTHSCAHLHTLCEDSVAVLPLPEGTSLTRCRRQQERPTILLGTLSSLPAGEGKRVCVCVWVSEKERNITETHWGNN